MPKAKASTQEHLDIEEIVDDLVVLKNGNLALVMATTAVNFDLLSEAEQDATIYAYGALLNSLTFAIEILIISKKADITSYFNTLEEAERNQPNPDLKLQVQKYKSFIESTVQQKTVLDKNFYIIIAYSPLEKGIAAVTGKKSQAKSRMSQVSDAKNSLIPKRDHLIKQTARLGLITRQLTTQELIELFYEIYNPAPTGTQRVLLDSSSYTTPIVEPAVEVPTPAPPTPQPAPQPTTSTLRPVPPRPLAEPSPVPPQAPSVSSPNSPIAQPPNSLISTPQPIATQVVAAPPTSTFQAPPSPTSPQPTSSPLPSAAGPSPVPSGAGPSSTQLEALRKLQEATAYATQVLKSTTYQNVPPQTNSSNQSTIQPNIERDKL